MTYLLIFIGSTLASNLVFMTFVSSCVRGCDQLSVCTLDLRQRRESGYCQASRLTLCFWRIDLYFVATVFGSICIAGLFNEFALKGHASVWMFFSFAIF